MAIFNIKEKYQPSLITMAYESSFPDTAPENTIGIISSVEITSTIFSSTQPIITQQGLLWVKTGTSSRTPIMLNSTDHVYIYPIAVRQYVDGQWTAPQGRCFQGGVWRDWDYVLYDNGVSYVDLNINSLNYSYQSSYIKINDAKTSISTSSNIDISSYSILYASVYGSDVGTGGQCWLGLYNNPASARTEQPNGGYTIKTSLNNAGIVTASHSLTQGGSNYSPGIYFVTANGGSNKEFRLYKLWLAV